MEFEIDIQACFLRKNHKGLKLKTHSGPVGED